MTDGILLPSRVLYSESEDQLRKRLLIIESKREIKCQRGIYNTQTSDRHQIGVFIFAI